MRRNMLEEEPYPAVLWWICKIDILALLSSCGNGDFIDDALRTDSVPTVATFLQSSCAGATSLRRIADRELLSSVLTLCRKTFLLAAEIGELAKQLRQSSAGGGPPSRTRPSDISLIEARRQVPRLRERLRECADGAWPAELAGLYRQRSLPAQIQSMLDQVSLNLYQMCTVEQDFPSNCCTSFTTLVCRAVGL